MYPFRMTQRRALEMTRGRRRCPFGMDTKRSFDMKRGRRRCPFRMTQGGPLETTMGLGPKYSGWFFKVCAL